MLLFLVPGPCDPEDLLDGVIFGAKYLGSTQLQSEKNPSTNARMTQAQEAVDRIKVDKCHFTFPKNPCKEKHNILKTSLLYKHLHVIASLYEPETNPVGMQYY